MRRMFASALAALSLLLVATAADAAGQNTRYVVPITTDGAGAATVYSGLVDGAVVQVRYVPGAAPIDTNGDLDITLETTGVVIANHDNIGTSAFTKVYKQATHGIDGVAAILPDADADAPALDYVYAADERIKVVIANGAAAKSGTLYFWVKQ
ncbi:MAG: hypothetical protein ACRECF_09285 [Methyloceanibacter sp.]